MVMFNEKIFEHIERTKMSTIIDPESNDYLKKFKEYSKYKKYLVVVENKPKVQINQINEITDFEKDVFGEATND